MKKIVIIVTVPVVLETWLKGQALFLSKSYDVEIITAYSDTVKEIEKYENVTIRTMDFTRKINILKDIKVVIQLFLYLFKAQPFMVYTLTPKAGLLGMFSSWLARTPNRIHNVVGLPHLEAVGKRKLILTITEKITYYFSSKLYCNSINLKKVIETLTHKSVSVIGNGSVNGVDTNHFCNSLFTENKLNILNKLNFNDNDFVITFVGRIVKDKGINELVNVFDQLYRKYPQIKLLLIGDYKNESDPISYKTQDIIKNNNSIRYLEFQEDVREYLSISSLFVLPSYREGLPNVLIEAGSFGIPLVATDINGCNEIINHGVNGLLVNKKDEKDLSHAMEKFIEDDEFYQTIKNNVRNSIISRYDQEYFWKELLQEFKKIEEAI